VTCLVAAGALPIGALAASTGGASASGGAGTSATGTSGTGTSGAARPSASSGSSSGGSTGGARAQPANQTVSASGNGISLYTRASGMLHGRLVFSGSVADGRSGKTVEIQRLGRQTGNRWADTTHGVTDGQGHFTAVWPANHIGRFSVRAVLRSGSSARAASGSPILTVTVFRGAIATVYGPGFYGSRTACGQVLRPNTIGVAHRSLPCGTPVAVLYHGRTLVVPVIDRGPYANHADWDLTEATARALAIDGTVTIGAVSLPRSRG